MHGAQRTARHYPPNDRANYDHALSAVATALGQTRFAVAWADGRARGLDAGGSV
jgi:hypothetical protein